MSAPSQEITCLETYRHYRITVRQAAGKWYYLCRRPYVLDEFTNSKTYNRPLSARTAARAAVNLDIALQASKLLLDDWLKSNKILQSEYMQMLNQLYLAANQRSH